MTRGWAAVAVVAFATSFTQLTPAMASAQPVARAATSCRLGSKFDKLGPTYVEQLNVSRTSCATGENVIKAYNHCRLKAGGVRGHCNSKVLGFRCSEKPRSSSPDQFVANTRCTAGREVVAFSYSENT